MLTARMNVIYYQRYVARLETRDRWLRVTAAVLATSGGLVAALKALGPVWVLGAGVVSTVCSSVTLVWHYPERARVAAALAPQYVNHFQSLERLFNRREPPLTEKEVDKCLGALEKTTVFEAEKVHDFNDALLSVAYQQVLRERGFTE